jgi:uncharacterized membrane protein
MNKSVKQSTRNSRENKRAKFSKTSQRRSPFVLAIGIGGVIALAAAGIVFAVGRSADQPAETALVPQVSSGEAVVRLPLATFDDGQARFYTHNADGFDIEYFVLRSSDGVVRAAFNACDVCYGSRLGYRQEGDEMICNNCGLRFQSVLINEVRGGCNPSPLDREIEGDELVIRVEDILAGAGYFR